uniref:AlNc14C201G8681 protein n=1 Tax=Albugo laibachii Nc14 TaxID=890382 RepID=F0WQL4_9STRA|nr:AlNc14C201G8681 [Albugo laibachii Nc14]|eukprot:CCA23623.1 AlNc14C201G8681 [Albugo laibachii Nc14]
MDNPFHYISKIRKRDPTDFRINQMPKHLDVCQHERFASVSSIDRKFRLPLGLVSAEDTDYMETAGQKSPFYRICRTLAMTWNPPSIHTA